MTPFEEQLRQAMARREPGPDFTARVLREVQCDQRQRGDAGVLRWFRVPQLSFAPRPWRFAVVAAVLLATSGSLLYQRHERLVRGEAARENLLTAVRIAGVKLHEVHRHVLEVQATEVNQ